ncbi:MAG TPA: single-stranded DNA-binding protein, partial [Tissierellaceae bacterium]|nr:single-stranded DNA-binding protein [Tissierellaceae bacterium]
TAICNFTIAIDRGMSKDKKDETLSSGGQVADFINIVTWAKTAEFAANYLKKGSQVGISGRLQSGKYTNKEGQTIYTTDVNCNEITMIDWADKQEKQGNTSDFNEVSNDSIPF